MNNENKILSILTNFGCHFSCPYCVYRENEISIPKTDINTFGWEDLEEELKKHKRELVSVSGGGDPLWNISNNILWWWKFNNLLIKYNCKLELHTSIIDFNNFVLFELYDLCERIVFHLQSPMQIRNIDYYLLNCKNIRVVFVVQEYYTESIINTIVNEVKNNNSVTELSFRQLIGKDNQPKYYLHDYLKARHKKDWYYIEQCDYNEYFVQDHIEKEYLKIK